MTSELALINDPSLIETVVVSGDLSPLTAAQRLDYYTAVCNSLGLNPLTKPFDYIKLNNRLVLYAKRDATDQLRKIHKVSITDLQKEMVEDIYIVTATAQDGDGRTDTATGAVNIASLKGDAKANALMKAETKAKRRVTLSIVGLGWLDETEIETIPNAELMILVDKPIPELSKQEMFDKIKSELGIPYKVAGFVIKQAGLVNGEYDTANNEQVWQEASTTGVLFWQFIVKADKQIPVLTPDNILAYFVDNKIEYSQDDEPGYIDQLNKLANSAADLDNEIPF